MSDNSSGSVKSSFVDKEIAKKPHLIHEVRAVDNSNGQVALYYVYVEPHQTTSFVEALAGGGDINLEQYGRVLAACYGDKPTVKVRATLKDRYGVEL